jgi:hypothetical protein
VNKGIQRGKYGVRGYEKAVSGNRNNRRAGVLAVNRGMYSVVGSGSSVSFVGSVIRFGGCGFGFRKSC